MQAFNLLIIGCPMGARQGLIDNIGLWPIEDMEKIAPTAGRDAHLLQGGY
jgi:hypothetical protein